MRTTAYRFVADQLCRCLVGLCAIGMELSSARADAPPVPLAPENFRICPDTGCVPTTISCVGVPIAAGSSADQIQQAVDSNPNGTTFCFASGTYVLNHYVYLNHSDKFICPVRRTCILTGQDQYRGAFQGKYETTHHVVKGFVIEHFISTEDIPASPDLWPKAGLQVRDYGLMEDNEIRYNRIGVSMGANTTARGNYIHHNRQYGVSGGPGVNILLEYNEVAWNNYGHFLNRADPQYDPNNDAGGSKLVGTRLTAGLDGLTWRGNHVHDNYGMGIWSDGNVRNVVYENNLVENNEGSGIDHEISWNAIIRNNTLRGNNSRQYNLDKSCWWGSQILLNNSQDVEIYGNVVEAIGVNAICIVNSNRGDSTPFPPSLKNVSIHDNIVKMSGSSRIGLVGDNAPSGVTFTHNTYYVDSTAVHWQYMTDMTQAKWLAAGQDATGAFLSW